MFNLLHALPLSNTEGAPLLLGHLPGLPAAWWQIQPSGRSAAASVQPGSAPDTSPPQANVLPPEPFRSRHGWQLGEKHRARRPPSFGKGY